MLTLTRSRKFEEPNLIEAVAVQQSLEEVLSHLNAD